MKFQVYDFFDFTVGLFFGSQSRPYIFVKQHYLKVM